MCVKLLEAVSICDHCDFYITLCKLLLMVTGFHLSNGWFRSTLMFAGCISEIFLITTQEKYQRNQHINLFFFDYDLSMHFMYISVMDLLACNKWCPGDVRSGHFSIRVL